MWRVCTKPIEGGVSICDADSSVPNGWFGRFARSSPLCMDFQKMMTIFPFAGIDLNDIFQSEWTAQQTIDVRNIYGKTGFGSIWFEMKKTYIAVWIIYITIPVKHGYVVKPSDWKYSTFLQHVKRGHYDIHWGSNGEPPGIKKLLLE